MAQPVQPEKAYFKDDGSIPNSALPLLVYRQAFTLGSSDLAAAIGEHFARNDWTGSWRASVFPFHHYHSTTHEVLAVYRGTATLQFGGEKGRKFAVKPGDVVVIPAGVGHKRMESSLDFSEQKEGQVKKEKLCKSTLKKGWHQADRVLQLRRSATCAISA